MIRKILTYMITVYVWVMLHLTIPTEAYAQSNLLRAQWEFSFMVSQLIQYAYGKGYRITFGDAYANSGHIKDSLHYIRLAIDINLFKEENGKFLQSTEGHKELGAYWESIGGRWGGDFGDGNHYEYKLEVND